jgi:hypothetical protein
LGRHCLANFCRFHPEAAQHYLSLYPSLHHPTLCSQAQHYSYLQNSREIGEEASCFLFPLDHHDLVRAFEHHLMQATPLAVDVAIDLARALVAAAFRYV